MRALLLAVVVACAVPAHAEPRVRGVRSVELPRPGAERTEAPRLVLSIGAPAGLGPADFQLLSTEDEAQIFAATKVVPFQDSDEAMAMIVLVDGKVRFLGDPEPDPVGAEPAPPIPGLWEEVRGALDVLGRVRARRTRVAVWVYGEGAPVERLALGEPALVNGDALGARKEHAGTRTGGLRRALEAAQARLATEEGRRVIVVIGDATDTVDEVSYRDVENELGAAAIEVYALLGSPRALDARAVAKLARLTRGTGGALFRAAEPAELPAQAERLLAAVESVYTVVFPGARAEDGAKLPFDGAEHELTVRVKQEELGVTVRLPRWDWPPVAPPEPGVRWWLWLLLGGIVLVSGVVVGIVLLRRPPEEEPEEEPAVVIEAPAPVAPAVSSTTIVLDTGAMPNVAWLVPMDGPCAYRTYRLLSSGASVIGTDAGCHVSVADGYMSRQHAEIVADGPRYLLVDRGSQNGTRVGDRTVRSHELIDNDVFTLGQTRFTFKSIT